MPNEPEPLMQYLLPEHPMTGPGGHKTANEPEAVGISAKAKPQSNSRSERSPRST
jgi:hypothetical protein